MTLDQIIIGAVVVQMIRQSWQMHALRQAIWKNEAELYSLAAQCRALANEFGYVITTPGLEERDAISC